MAAYVPLFLSSTFQDFAPERRLIHERVVPDLRVMAGEIGLDLRLVDFRWGVTAREVEQARTLELCLQEVDRCRARSSELHLLVLLGDRSGSRLMPRRVLRSALDELCVGLRSAHPRGAVWADWLDASYTEERTAVRAAGEAARGAGDRIVSDPELVAALAGLGDLSPGARRLREELSNSATHLEILRSGALDGHEGVVAVIREYGEPDPMQLRMRADLQRSLGERCVTIRSEDLDGDRRDPAYEEGFVRTVKRLLGQRLRAARYRGRPEALVLARRTPALPSPVHDVPTPAEVEATAWLEAPGGKRALAIVGAPGAGRSWLLRELAGRLVREGAHVLHLEVAREPELQPVHSLLATLLLDAAGDGAVERLGDLDCQSEDLMGLVAGAYEATAGPAWVLVDDLDAVDVVGDAVRAPISWLWAGAAHRAVLTCGPALGAVLAEDPDVRVLELRPHAAERWVELAADPEVPSAWSGHEATPGFAVEVRSAVRAVGRESVQSWLAAGAAGFRARWIAHLLEAGPFDALVGQHFLALAATSRLGVAAQDFLAYAGAEPAVRARIAEQFPLSAFEGDVPPLVWAKLERHFETLCEQVGGHGHVALRVKARFLAGVGGVLEAGLVDTARRWLIARTLAALETPSVRRAALLPALLTDADDERPVLVRALRSTVFLANAIASDRGTALAQLLAGSAQRHAVVADVMARLDDSTIAPHEQSHWLLDLSILLRAAGFFGEASAASTRALELRRGSAGAAAELELVASIESSTALLDQGEFAAAERLLSPALIERAAAAGRRAERLHLLGNRAAALAYLGRSDETEAVVEELEALIGGDPRHARERMQIHSARASMALLRGEPGVGVDHARAVVQETSRYFGARSPAAAVRLGSLAVMCAAADEADAALDASKRAWAIVLEHEDRQHPWLAEAGCTHLQMLVTSGRPAAEGAAVVIAMLEAAEVLEDAVPWFHEGASMMLGLVEQRTAQELQRLADLVETLALRPAEPAGAARFTSKLVAVRGRGDPEFASGYIAGGYLLWALVLAWACAEGLVGETATRRGLRLVLGHVARQFPNGVVERRSLDGALRLAARETTLPDHVPLEFCIATILELGGVPAAELVAEGEAAVEAAGEASRRGDHLAAAAAMLRAVEVADLTFPDGDERRAIVRMNLASTLSAGGRMNDAFDAYRAGLRIAAAGGGSFAHFGPSIERMLEAGVAAERFADLAELLEEVLEPRADGPATSLGLAVMRARACGLVGDGDGAAGAVRALRAAVDRFGELSADDAAAALPALLHTALEVRVAVPVSDLVDALAALAVGAAMQGCDHLLEESLEWTALHDPQRR